jgi:hypothetical protein
MAVSHWLKERRMLRKFVFALLTFGVVTVGLLADEFRGKVKSVDADKMTITVAGKDGEKTFTVNKDTKFVKAGKKGEDPTPLPEGLKDKMFTADTPPGVTITFEAKDGKDVVSEVKVGRAGKGKGKGKDKN